MLLSSLHTPARHAALLTHPVWSRALEGLARLSPNDPDATLDWMPDSDLGFFLPPATPCTRLILHPGDFAVFFPDDAHMPKIQAASPTPLRKAVVKIDITLL